MNIKKCFKHQYHYDERNGCSHCRRDQKEVNFSLRWNNYYFSPGKSVYDFWDKYFYIQRKEFHNLYSELVNKTGNKYFCFSKKENSFLFKIFDRRNGNIKIIYNSIKEAQKWIMEQNTNIINDSGIK